jgi:hypothetical protein
MTTSPTFLAGAFGQLRPAGEVGAEAEFGAQASQGGGRRDELHVRRRIQQALGVARVEQFARVEARHHDAHLGRGERGPRHGGVEQCLERLGAGRSDRCRGRYRGRGCRTLGRRCPGGGRPVGRSADGREILRNGRRPQQGASLSESDGEGEAGGDGGDETHLMTNSPGLRAGPTGARRDDNTVEGSGRRPLHFKLECLVATVV